MSTDIYSQQKLFDDFFGCEHIPTIPNSEYECKPDPSYVLPGPMTGLKHLESSKAQMSESHTGVKLSPEHRRKQSEGKMGHIAWNKGIPLSEEHCRKMSESNSGEGNPMYGRTHTEATKKLQSESKKGVKRKPFSAETKRKMRESAIKRWSK